MTGVVTTRHLLRHAVLIVRQFGLRTYLSCCYRVVRHPRRTVTFLGSIY